MKRPKRKLARKHAKKGRAVRLVQGRRRSKLTQRAKYVIGNWKMNPQTLAEAKETFRSVKKTTQKLNRTNVVMCPPFVYLTELARLSDDSIRMGVQNIFWKESGSYTGEVSASQARDAGADYCIVGHSERRALGETDAEVAKKAMAAVRSGMKAIICVGEKERDLEGGEHLEFLEHQVKNSFQGITKRDLGSVILAYEPVWAIGKSDDEAMTGNDLYEMSLFIRKVLLGLYGKDAAFALPVLYGGSVTFRNTEDIVKEGKVDGLLVGRQSLDAGGFAEVLAIVDSI